MAGISNLSAIHRYPFAPWLPHPTASFTHFHPHLHFHELHLLPYGKIGGDEMRLRALLETDALACGCSAARTSWTARSGAS